MSGEEEDFLADETAYIIGDEDEGPGEHTARGSVSRQLGEEVCGDFGYVLRPFGWFAQDARVVRVCEDPGPVEPRREELAGPGFRAALGCPGCVLVSVGAVDEADIYRGVGRVVPCAESFVGRGFRDRTERFVVVGM